MTQLPQNQSRLLAAAGNCGVHNDSFRTLLEMENQIQFPELMFQIGTKKSFAACCCNEKMSY